MTLAIVDDEGNSWIGGQRARIRVKHCSRSNQDSQPPAEALRGAVASLFGIEPTLIAIAPSERGADEPAGPTPVVLITMPDSAGGFGLELEGGDELATAGGSSLQTGQGLCRRLGVRALVDDGSDYPDYWTLIARDGSFGRVFTDPDTADGGKLLIQHALEPISGEPDLQVIPPPEWARDW